MQFCHASRADLAAEFAKLNLTTAVRYTTASPSSPSTATKDTTLQVAQQNIPKPEPSPELALIHTAMRKLRESLLATHRVDDFAKSTYLFIARACILSKAWEAYVPSLAHLVHTIHKHTPLSEMEMRELTSYQVLDLACRQRDVAAAFALRRQRGLKDENVNDILKAVVRDEWWRYWAAKKRVDGYVRAVMEFAEEDIRKHALKCLARTYFVVERSFVEKTAGRDWLALVEQGVGWELEKREDGKEMIVVRRVKAN